MKIPFSVDKFLSVFENYNQALWPVQVIFYMLAVVAMLVVVKQWWQAERVVFSILAFLWIWMGCVYHILYLSTVNAGAYVFGIFFILQGFIFIYYGVIRQRITLRIESDFSSIAGVVLIVYSLFVYPVIGYVSGHFYPHSPTFGVPTPTTIFTFGILLLSPYRLRWYIMMIPFLWSIIGFFTAFNLSLREDYGLVFAGLLASVILIFLKPRRFIAAAIS
jgi:hypothetical protein